MSLHVRKDAFDAAPAFSHPAFDMESRIVQAALGNLVVASVYVPNGGKDYAAKLAFLKSLAAWARRVHERGPRARALRRHQHRAQPTSTCTRASASPASSASGPRSARCSRRCSATGLVDVGRTLDPDNDGLFTWWPPWRNMRKRNIGWRLDYVLASKAIAERGASCKVLADFGTSDHAPVVMTL